MQEPAKVPKSILKKSPAQASRSAHPILASPIKSPAHRRVVLPSSFHPQKKHPKRRNFCRFFCSFLLVALLILVASLVVAGGLFYLWFAPKLPVFKLRAVQMNRFAVTTRPDGTSYLRTGANVWVVVKNPNERLVFCYGGSQMKISADEDVELGSASLPEFTQVSGNVTVLRFVTRTGSGNQAVDAETGKWLNAAVKSGAAKLNVGVKTKVWFGVGKFLIGVLPADLACGGVSLKKLKDGGPLKCQIKWFGW